MVGEKDLISALSKGGKSIDRSFVRADPTLKMSMVSETSLPRTVVITQKESSSVQRCGLSLDRSVPGDNVVPEKMSYVCTMKVAWSSELRVQSVCQFDDHTNEILLGLDLVSVATPPVWISQIMMAVSEAQAREHPSGE